MNTTTVQFRTIAWGIVLTLLWVCCFLFIKPTLVIEFGGGINMNLKLLAITLGLLVIVLYHIFDRPSPDTTKLSLTVDLTLSWLALIIFFPFKDQLLPAAGAVAFFTLIMGLGVSVLWVHFFADEII